MTELDIQSDPKLAPAEKETIVRMDNDTDRLKIHTEQPSVTRWLLEHPEYQVDSRRVVDGTVVATSGYLPVGCLKLSGSSRKSNHTSSCLGKLPSDGDSQ